MDNNKPAGWPVTAAPDAPAYRIVTFICEVPADAKLIAIDGRVVLIAPMTPACWVTATGLEPIPMREQT